jgi:mono/diheme cytochrome c family protein
MIATPTRYGVAALPAFATLMLLSGCDPYKGMTQLEIGQKVYKSQCAICHQIDGSGVAGNQPALAASSITNGDKEALLEVILRGSSAVVLAERDAYSTYMASYSHLKDLEIAAVASYIRTSFGNNASTVTESEVAAQR